MASTGMLAVLTCTFLNFLGIHFCLRSHYSKTSWNPEQLKAKLGLTPKKCVPLFCKVQFRRHLFENHCHSQMGETNWPSFMLQVLYSKKFIILPLYYGLLALFSIAIINWWCAWCTLYIFFLYALYFYVLSYLYSN